MERAASDAPAVGGRVAAWAEDTFARLNARPGVRRVGLALLEGGGRRLQFTASDRDGSGTAWCHVDAYDDVPLNAAVRSGLPVVGSLAALEPRYPAFVAQQRDTTTAALAAVPFVHTGHVLGGFVLFYDDPPDLDGREGRDLTRLARALAASLRTAQRRGQLPSASEDVPAGALVAVHEVPSDPAAVGEARTFLRDTLAGWSLDESMADAALLCLSELVTNAVIHTHDGCLVRVVRHEGVVRVTVRDAGTGAARLARAADPLQVHGRGLHLVEALAARWGHEVDADGLSVWFELVARDAAGG